ncbi:MAG: TIGR03087 family PEP-CTERM/XrtA system glycosyltransferase [Acidobacteriota bacterium]
MKLLFLAHRIPYPPNKGDKIRSYHELRALARRGHEVHLMAFADDPHDLQYQVELARWCASVRIVRLRKPWATLSALAELPFSRPLSLGYFGSWKMKRLVERALTEQKFDAVFVYSSAMAQYVPVEWHARTIVDLVDVDSEKWREYAERASTPRSWLYGLEAARLRKYEHEVVQCFAQTVLTTPREAALLNELDEFTRRARLRIITNGVDMDYFQPAEMNSFPRTKTSGQLRPLAPARGIASAPRLVFTGAMDYYANVEAVEWFAAEVLPLIREQEPEAEFFVVGSNPTAQVKKLARQPGVTVTGFVEDVRPHIYRATACVVPLRIARGVQNKLLEAMACGKAVIATPQAAAGLNVRNGEDLLLTDSPSEFAAAALMVIRNATLRESLGWQARSFVEAEHEWQPLLQRLIELVESVAQRQAESADPKSRKVRSIARH